MPDERFSLKDHLFNEEKVAYLAGLLDEAIPGFDSGGFQTAVMARLPELELKERIAHIADVLEKHLDADFKTAAKQITNALPPPLDPTLEDDDFGDFIFAPFGEHVARHGLAHFDVSMDTLKQLTMRFSMEGPLRAFINGDPQRTLAVLEEWAHDQNYHVRRLVSEGTRPRLPWAPRIDLDIEAPLPLLHILHADPTRYVTRSVANHLNDIAKVEPELVIDTLKEWEDAGAQDPKELAWMNRHALRTLIKDGHPKAMEHLGYSPEPQVEARLVHLSETVRPGETVEFEIEISARKDEPLIVDYAIDFVKKNGGTKAKVFKLKQLEMKAGEVRTLKKRHPLRANATTFTLHSGVHGITINANGAPIAEGRFELVEG